MADLFYIQDNRSCVGNEALWWCEKGAGYTTDLSKAGRFSEPAAYNICANRETDVAWPCAEIEALAYRAVYVGDLRRARTAGSVIAPEEQTDG